MQTLLIIWFTGGLICTLVYLVHIWPTFRDHRKTTGGALELFHFGSRALMLFVLWPVVVVAYCVVLFSKRQTPNVE